MSPFFNYDDYLPASPEGSLTPTSSNASINTMSPQDVDEILSDSPDLAVVNGSVDSESDFPDLVDVDSSIDYEFNSLDLADVDTTSSPVVNASYASESDLPDLVDASNDFYDIGNEEILSGYLEDPSYYVAKFTIFGDTKYFLISCDDIYSIHPLVYALKELYLMNFFH